MVLVDNPAVKILDSKYLWNEPVVDRHHRHVISPIIWALLGQVNFPDHYNTAYVECDDCTAFCMIPRNIALIAADYR